MNHQWLVSSFTVSSLIHLSLIPVAALIMHAKPLKPITVPIELVDVARVEQPKKIDVAPLPSAPKPKAKDIIAPKLLSKPVIETSPLPPSGNTKEEVKEKPVEQQLASLPDNSGTAKAGWNLGSKAAEAEGSAAGAGNLFGNGDVGVVGGSSVEGGGGGKGTSRLGRGTKGDGAGGGIGSGEALSGMARAPRWLSSQAALSGVG